MPTLSAIVHWLDAHALAIALWLSLAAALLRALYAMLSRVLAPYPRARAFVEAVAAMAPDVLRFAGQVYALLAGRALPSTGAVSVPADDTPPDGDRHASIVPPAPVAPAPVAPRDGQRGSADVRSLAAAAVVALCVGAALGGCPNWQRPACGTPGAYSCAADQPHVCAPTSRELTPIGDESCSRQGRVCALSDAGVARCVRATDGGAE